MKTKVRFMLLLVMTAVLSGCIESRPTVIPEEQVSIPANSLTKLYTSSAEILPTIGDMPSGARMTAQKVEENASERDFKVDSRYVYYISTKFTTIEEAKAGFTAVKTQKAQKYKLDDIKVGDEAFLYSSNEFQRIVILRKSNVYVIIISDVLDNDELISYTKLLKL